MQWLGIALLTLWIASGSLLSTGCALTSGSGSSSTTTNPTPTPTPTTTATPTPTPTPTTTATPTPTPTPAPTNKATVPTQSSTIAISADSKSLLAVNPENDSVSIFDASGSSFADTNKVAEIAVGDDPRSVGVLPGGTKAYVANAGSGTVTVIDLTTNRISKTISVGVEPYAVVFSPNGTRAYVANSVSNSISVIDTSSDAQITGSPFGLTNNTSATMPRALAITNDGDADDTDETLYIAEFFSARRPNKTGLDEGQDDQRQGHVLAFNCGTNTVSTVVRLEPVFPGITGPQNTGFASNGHTLAFLGTTNGATATAAQGLAPSNPPTFTAATGCWPNQLAALSIHPTTGRAYVVSTAASPNGPVRFNVNMQGLCSVFETTGGSANTEVRAAGTVGLANPVQDAPLVLNNGLQRDTTSGNSPKLFLSNPTGIAWRPTTGSEAWICVQTTDLVVRMTVNSSGVPTIGAASSAALGASGNISRTDLQTATSQTDKVQAPFGLCFNASGANLFVNNFVSRRVTRINPATGLVSGTAQSAGLPASGSLEATVQRGAELFFSGRGPKPTASTTGRMSSEGWGACIACHPDGRSDNVTWMFGAGPRNTISMDGMFSKRAPLSQRILNYSAINDENQDFENNTRGVSGGRGLIDEDRLVVIAGGSDSTGTARGFGEGGLFLPGGNVTPLNVLPNQPLTGGIFPDLPVFPECAVATLLDGRMYIIGGNNGGTASNQILEYDPSTNVSRTRANLGTARRFAVAAALRGVDGKERIYIFGGYDASDNTLTSSEIYDPVNNTLAAGPTMQFPRAEAGIATIRAQNTANPVDYADIICGNVTVTFIDTPSPTNTILRFRPTNNSLTEVTQTNFLTPRFGLGAATYIRGAQPVVGVFGGVQDASFNVTSAIQEYNATNTNNSVNTATITVNASTTQLDTGPFALAGARAYFAIGTCQNQVLLAGGIVDSSFTVTNTVVAFNPAANPAPTQPGRPNGTISQAGVAFTGRAFSVMNTPPPANSFTPVGNSLRNDDQDAISEWVKVKVRPTRGIPDASQTSDRAFFVQVGLTVSGVSCATCHGGPKWTRSTVDYLPSPSADTAFGVQQIIGTELRKTASQPGDQAFNGVLTDVGTFLNPVIGFDPAFAGLGRTVLTGPLNEIRTNPADQGDRAGVLGTAGYNIPSLLSSNSSGPYFHNGIAQTLDEVLGGTFDQNGASSLRGVHNVSGNASARAALIRFLNSIDETTTPEP